MITGGFSIREVRKPKALKSFMKSKSRKQPVGLQTPNGKLLKRRNRRHKLWIKKCL